MHVGRGRKHPLHVEYVHIGVTLSFIQDVLTEAILSHPRLRLDKKIALVKALGKVIWIQNDLFAKWYVRDGDEFAEEIQEPEVEREGYLHGKKIINSESESEIEEPELSGCPFKNLTVNGTGGGVGGIAGSMGRLDIKVETPMKEEAVVAQVCPHRAEAQTVVPSPPATPPAAQPTVSKTLAHSSIPRPVGSP